MNTPSIPGGERKGWRRDGPRFALVGWIIASIAMLGMAIVAAILFATSAAIHAALSGERSTERLQEIAQQALESDSFSWVLLIVSQVALLACAWIACIVLQKRSRERLGLVTTNLGPVRGAVLLVATVIPFVAGLSAAWLVITLIGGANHELNPLQRMWYAGSRTESAAWILLIGLLPGFAEEIFYRGFLQRGLLMKWGPTASIATSTLLFALVHGELAAAVAMLPLGLWLGVVAWRTGSVAMTIVMHASLNASWTAGMMVLHRDPGSESMLGWVAAGVLVLGVVAFPWAIVILRHQRVAVATAGGAGEPARPLRPLRLVLQVAAGAIVAGSLAYMMLPPRVAPLEHTPPEPASLGPTLQSIEAGATESAICTAIGEAGAVEFPLQPGVGTRVTLPRNRAGVHEVIIVLGSEDETVWLAYAGESSGKGGAGRPAGIVEQLAPDEPTVLSVTIAPGTAPVMARLVVEDDAASLAEAFERASAEGWAMRGRKRSDKRGAQP